MVQVETFDGAFEDHDLTCSSVSIAVHDSLNSAQTPDHEIERVLSNITRQQVVIVDSTDLRRLRHCVHQFSMCGHVSNARNIYPRSRLCIRRW